VSRQEPKSEPQVHEPPKGALLLMLTYLLLIAVLWANVYLQLVRGGVAKP